MKGWRTIVVFGASGLLYLAAWPQLTQILSPEQIAIGTTILGILMRLITTSPVGSKG